MRRGEFREIIAQMRPADWAVIALGIALSIAAALWVWLPQREPAGRVNIYIDAKLVATLPLDVDQDYTITGFDDASYANVLRIEGGAARMLSANCPDGYCLRQGAVSSQGQALICLPHRLVIEPAGGKESALDAIVG